MLYRFKTLKWYQQPLQRLILSLQHLDKKLYGMKCYNILRKHYNAPFIFWLVLALLTYNVVLNL
jgi:hypothetical protein